MIGVLIPGNKILEIEITGEFSLFEINDPKRINNIGLYLMKQIPDDLGAALFFSVPPYESKEFIGCVANVRPSDSFYTGWNMNPIVNSQEIIKVAL